MLFCICRVRECGEDVEPDELVAEHIRSGVIEGRMWMVVEFTSNGNRKLNKKNLQEARDEFKGMYDVIGLVRASHIGKDLGDLLPSRLCVLSIGDSFDDAPIFKDCRRCGFNKSSRELCRNASCDGGFENLCKECKRTSNNPK